MFSSISLGARARPRPGRVTTSARFFSSTKTAPSHWARNAVVGGLITGPALYWATSSRDEKPSVSLTGVPGVPRLDTPPTEHLTFGPGLSRDQVTQIISQNAYSVPVSEISGVSRYDGTQWASNSPCEDRFFHGQFPSPWNDGKQWMAWAVFDGHAGWQTAELLKHKLLPYVRHSLDQVRSDEKVPAERVQEALVQGFLNLDAAIFKAAEDASRSDEPLQDRSQKMEPAWAGSCALLSILDSTTNTLHVACTGDSRALLGQQRPDGTWEAIPLSVDQSGSNEEEVARLQQEHPGEENIVKDGRVLGIMVSRAFGDSRWKWPLDLQTEMHKRFYAPAPLTPRYDVRTPPYLTAEPVVTSTKIDPSRPSFLIMASDGLWDNLSSEQAVGLMGKWLGSPSGKRSPSSPTASRGPRDFVFGKGVEERFVEERTTVQDDNAAVHLTRNSLGGNQHELIAGRLGFGSPFSRYARDDITVQVVFFHDLQR
ncbi:protein serine/threonine phosphatase 2C [Penicillium verhagenii]|uniref:protein serine/threonine phosphatase 2C n=1 Tax=Penicillium verhagenii TaxID=1562060 RepID=UPI00254516ED|nr:protein serine/threonine phosphatase 2C [Penicillium verhagenii]KAJ5924283.1 protein serine/threonine phosphatase 2C [Penicillium verhagenii]